MIKINYLDGATAIEIVLPDDLVLKGDLDSNKIHAEYTRTLSGKLVIENTTEVLDGKLVLEGTVNNGWISRVKANEIKLFLDSWHESFLVTYNTDTFTCVLDRSTRSSITPLLNNSAYNDDSIYILNVNLIRIN